MSESPNNDTVKKSLALIGAATGFVLGGFGITQIASAQTTDETPSVEQSEDTESEDTESTETEDQDANESEDKDGDRQGHRGRDGDCGDRHEAVAELLGLSTDELRAELEAGNSLADIAEANGVDSQELVDLMVAQATERADAKVESGDITQAEADEKLADVAERAEEKISSTDGPGGRRGHGPRGDRDADGATEDTNTTDDADQSGDA